MQVAYLKMDHLQDDEVFEYRERPKQVLLSVAATVSNGWEDATVTLTDGSFGNFAKMLKSEKDCSFIVPPFVHHVNERVNLHNARLYFCCGLAVAQIW